MKIKRPLINQFYEEGDQETEEQKHEPLQSPLLSHIKPLEEASKQSTEAPTIKQVLEEEPQEEVVIQTKASPEFLKWKAEQEKLAKQKLEEQEKARLFEEARVKAENQARIQAEAEARRLKGLEEIKRIQQEQKRKERAVIDQPALPKTAVRAEEMPQVPKQIKKPAVIPVSDEQLVFPITPRRVTFEQRLQFIRMYFERRQELLEVSMLWKNPSLPFNIVSVIFVIGLLFVGGIFEFDKIPSKIPLFYNHVEKSWEQADKSAIFIIGTVLLAAEGLLINLIIKIFRSDRRLALTLSWVITFINVLIIVAALQIYSLIT